MAVCPPKTRAWVFRAGLLSASQLCPWPEGLCLPGAARSQATPLSRATSVLPRDQLSPTGPLADAGTAQAGDAGHTSFPTDLTRQTVVFLVMEQLFPLLSRSPWLPSVKLFMSPFSKYLQKTARSPQTLR